MRGQLFFILLTTFITVSKPVFSQGEEDNIKSIIKSFNEDINKMLSNGSAVADLLISYVNPNFNYQRKVVNIFNNVAVQNMDYKTISSALREMRSSNVTSKRSLGSLDDIVVRNKLAVAHYTTTYELYESDKLINKGRQYIELIFRKNPSGEWKIDGKFAETPIKALETSCRPASS